MNRNGPTNPEQRRLLTLVDEAVDLHTLPVVVLEADRLMRDRRTSAQDIATVIARDLALAERVLRLANSAYYGFQRRIGNLTQAVVLLGFQTVRNLLLTVSVIETFRPEGGDETDYPRFWAHSVGCAIAATEIARRAGIPNCEEAYVAGLLHDVGKLLVVEHLPAVGRTLHQQLAATPAADPLEVERSLLGLDHSDIGSKLAAAWGLPETITDAVRDHHTDQASSGTGATLADAVQLADCLLHALGLGAERQSLPAVVPGLSARLGYDAGQLAEWIEGVQAALDEARDFFEFIGAPRARLLTIG